MASLDSANGPSATTRPFLPETTLPSRSSGFPAMAFPCAVNRSNQLFHLLTTFCVSSGDSPLCQSLPRNSSMYSEFVVCAFIIFFLLMVDCFRSVNNTTNDPRHLGHRTQSFSSPVTRILRNPKGCNRKSGANGRAKSYGPFNRSSDRLCRSAGEPREAHGDPARRRRNAQRAGAVA